MKTCLLAFGICSMFFVGCVGADDADIDAEDGMIDEAEQALCVSAPTLDAPSTNWSLALSSSGSGDEVSRTSPDASYASSGDNYYTTEITGFPAGGLSNQAVFATHADPPTDSSLCGFAKIEASYTCFDPAQNCWVDCGSSSALGTWTAGNYCLATTGISVPVGYTKVRVKAKATTFVLFGWVAKKVQEGGSWFNNP